MNSATPPVVTTLSRALDIPSAQDAIIMAAPAPASLPNAQGAIVVIDVRDGLNREETRYLLAAATWLRSAEIVELEGTSQQALDDVAALLALAWSVDDAAADLPPSAENHGGGGR